MRAPVALVQWQPLNLHIHNTGDTQGSQCAANQTARVAKVFKGLLIYIHILDRTYIACPAELVVLDDKDATMVGLEARRDSFESEGPEVFTYVLLRADARRWR